MKHPVLATIAAAGTLAAIVAAYQRGERVYQEMVDKGEIDPLVRLNNANKREAFDNRQITDLALPEEAPAAKLYRIPDGETTTSISTPFGVVRLRPAVSYFRGYGIFVYFPQGIRFGKKQTHDILCYIAKRFHEATNEEFHFDRNPGSSLCGDDDIATGIISAGLNGYARRDAPGIREVTRVLALVIQNLDVDDIREFVSITENSMPQVVRCDIDYSK